jgi:hypothetical protein
MNTVGVNLKDKETRDGGAGDSASIALPDGFRHAAPVDDLTRLGQRLTATVPRRLATILNATIVAGMIVLLHRCRTARLFPAARLHISYTKDMIAAVRCCSLQVIALIGAELIARTSKSERVQTSGEMRALAKSLCGQV